jgi:hypothetical protein
LAVGDDRERLERRGRHAEPIGPEVGGDVRGLLRRGDELPVVAVVREAKPRARVPLGELGERNVDLLRRRADGLRQLGSRHRLLGDEQHGLDRARDV